MRVLIICKALPNNFKGGIQTHVWALSDHLAQQELRVSILTSGSWKNGIRKYRAANRTIIEIPHFPLRKSWLFKEILEELAFNIAVLRWVRKHHHQYDLIHLQGRSGYMIPWLKLSCPVVATVHRLWKVEGQWGKQEFNSRLEEMTYRYLTNFLEHQCLKKVKAVIGVSQSTIEEIDQYTSLNADNLHLIYNGTQVERRNNMELSNSKQLLFVGRLTAVKGVFSLIESLKYLPKDIELVVVGEGPAEKALEVAITKNKLESRVQLLGSLPYQKVRSLMRQCYALILPSFHESQGMVLLESNAEGRPVLAAAVAGVLEVVQPEHNGLLFEPGRPKQIAEAVRKLFSNPERAAQMGAWGQRFVKAHFNWKDIAQQTIQLYQSL